MKQYDSYYSFTESGGVRPSEPRPVRKGPVVVTRRSPGKLFARIGLFVLVAALLGGALFAGGSAVGLLGKGGNGSTTVLWGGSSSGSGSSSSGTISQLVESDKTVLTTDQIYEKLLPSVVGVLTQTSMGEGTGSGMIMNTDGYILTNAHVVSDARSIEVILSDERKFKATLIGSDKVTDIAVIKIKADNLKAATFGDSDKVKVGERAVAIGNPLGMDLSFSLTQGVISAINRNITVENTNMTLIQTDAAINEGNSGGPLINQYGEIIGINSVKIIDTSAEGLGFAIPINTAMPIVKQLIENGYVPGRPVIGITAENVTEEDAKANGIPVGVYVRYVSQDSPASKSGILPGDVIVAFNNDAITDLASLTAARDKCKAGDTVKVKVVRAGDTLELSLTLGEDKSGQ